MATKEDTESKDERRDDEKKVERDMLRYPSTWGGGNTLEFVVKLRKER